MFNCIYYGDIIAALSRGNKTYALGSIHSLPLLTGTTVCIFRLLSRNMLRVALMY